MTAVRLTSGEAVHTGIWGICVVRESGVFHALALLFLTLRAECTGAPFVHFAVADTGPS